MRNQLKFSNCLIEAVKCKMKYPEGSIGYDFNSPTNWISFYFDIKDKRFRFRRKMMVRSNKSKIIFWGYRVIETI